MTDPKWLCVECGKKKEEYEAMFCDKCFTEFESDISVKKFRGWQALQAFYKLKAKLPPPFIERNKSSLNGLEADLMREWKGGNND